MAEFRLSPKAQRDLDSIFDYTVSEWGLEQAFRYDKLIETTCAELANSPLLAPSCAHIRRGYRRRSVQQHVIYFRQTSYGITIIRILHQRMDAGRHL
jgi:toxin ParE1/3/4